MYSQRLTKSSRVSCFKINAMDMLYYCAALLLLQGYVSATCRFPGAPAHSRIVFSNDSLTEGTVATYACERGFELLGPARRVCDAFGKWIPDGIPFCVLNVAAGKAPMQVSTQDAGVPQRALDGSTAVAFNPSTCTLTNPERIPWWYVNLLEPYMVQLVRLDFGRPCCGDNQPASIVVRVGNQRPDSGTNPVCNRFIGYIEEGQPLFLPCNPPMPGAFVSVHLESNNPPNQLSICEAFVYTDQALPIERCPQFRDQPPGSTATYNGKCYIFYNSQPVTFGDALDFCRSRGGTLVDEGNPALQGFISWELWRRHRSDNSSQYWMGAVRDAQDSTNWKWITGNDVTVSFWSTPGGIENCARFDSTNGWLWSDTNCEENLNFICQHQPKTCGRPEQPPNSTMIAESFDVGASVEYSCDEGHVLVGPTVRTCLNTGFYDEFPPVCKRIDCGYPAEISLGRYELINGSITYLSHVQYSCQPGYEMVGRSRLVCDIDERWNGPPPRCDVIRCEEPPQISNGRVLVANNASVFGSVAEFSCLKGHKLVGTRKTTCLESGLWEKPFPRCQLIQCEEPSQIPNGRVLVSHNASVFGAVAEYFCLKGFKLVGARKISCLASGSWDKSFPHCQLEEETTTTSAPTTTLPPRTTVASSPPTTPHRLVLPTRHTRTSPRPSPSSPTPFHPTEFNSAGKSNNIRSETSSPVLVPLPVDSERNVGARFNMGAVVAVAAFGGLVFLIVITITIVMLVKSRKSRDVKRYRPHVGHDQDCSKTVASMESSSSESRSGLNKYYRQAWQELHEATGGKHHRRHERDAPDDSDLIVLNVIPHARDKRHHHHHHHRRDPRYPDVQAPNRPHHNHKPRH